MLFEFTGKLLSKRICKLGILVGCHLAFFLGGFGQEMTPWESGEELVFRISEKVDHRILGYAVSSIQESREESELLWRIEFRAMLNEISHSIVDVNQKDFLPVYSKFYSPSMGEIESSYEDGGVSVNRRPGQDRVPLSSRENTYSIYQSFYLLRELPVEKNYQTELYMVNPRKPGNQVPAVMKIVEMEHLDTPLGRVFCYRVDALIDDQRRSFWFGTDVHRYLYRVEDESGLTLELIDIRNGMDQAQVVPFGKDENYSLVLESGWYVFPKPSPKGLLQTHSWVILSTHADADISISQYDKFGELSDVVAASEAWLSKNKKRFKVLESSRITEEFEEFAVQSFIGTYKDGRRERSLLNCVIQSDLHLFILTVDDAHSFSDEYLEQINAIIRGIQRSE